MIKVIAFDYAEVVAEGPMSKWVREHLHQDQEKLIAYRKHAHKWDVGEMELTQVYKILGEFTEIKPEDIWGKFYEKSRLNTKVIKIIKNLKKEYKIILFSNFISELLLRLLKYHKIENLFDEIIVSSDYGLKKPDPKFFEILVKKSGVKRSEIVFTDDKINNVSDAILFGIKAYQFVSAEKLIQDLKAEGVKI